MSELDKNWINEVNTRLESFEARLSKVEQHLSGLPEKSAVVSKPKTSKGPTGAIMQLIEEHFLDEPKLVKEIQTETNRLGHYYTTQTLDSYLRRLNKAKVLTRIGRKGEWRYAIRR